MKKTHIVFTTYDSLGNPYYNGGGAHAIHEIARRLTRWYQVTIVAGSYPKAVNRIIDGVRYHYHGLDFNSKLSQLSFVISLPFFVRRLHPDIVIESFTPPFSISCLPLRISVPVVGLVHMLSARDMERKYHLPFTWIENIGLSWYKHFIVLSGYWKNIIRGNNSTANYYIIPNAVEKCDLKPTKVKKYFLFLGRIELDQKGIDLLLAAWAEMHNPPKLVIAGAGSESEIYTLKSLIEKHPNKNKIIYEGHIKGDKKFKLLANAVATVIPSRYETFSMTALESLSTATPIVTFDIPGMDWVNSSAVLRARSFDPQSLAETVLLLAKDDSMRKKMSLSAKKESTKYNYDRAIKSYHRLIEGLT